MPDKEVKDIPSGESGVYFQEHEQSYNLTVQIAKNELGKVALAGSGGSLAGSFLGKIASEIVGLDSGNDALITSATAVGAVYGAFYYLNRRREGESKPPETEQKHDSNGFPLT